MDNRVNRSSKRKPLELILYSLAGLILAALLVDGVFGPHGFIATYRLRLQVKQAQQKAERLDQENQEFTTQVQQLKSDPSAIERVARQKMGLVKPGEFVFKLPTKPSANSAASSSAKTPGTPSTAATQAPAQAPTQAH